MVCSVNITTEFFGGPLFSSFSFIPLFFPSWEDVHNLGVGSVSSGSHVPVSYRRFAACLPWVLGIYYLLVRATVCEFENTVFSLLCVGFALRDVLGACAEGCDRLDLR